MKEDNKKSVEEVLKDLRILAQEKIDSGELEGWSRGIDFKRKEECHNNGHQWSGGCSSDGYTWKEFCTHCLEKRTRMGYPDWWFKPIC